MAKKELTQREMAEMGGRAVLKKYGKRRMREWGVRGGRPRKDGKPPRRKEAK